MIKVRTLAFTILLSSSLVTTALSQEAPIQARTQTFLDAYARGDVKTILPMVDQDRITMYGSDVAEVAHGAEALTRLMNADQMLWGGTAHTGAMQNVSLIQNRDLASIVFDVSFTVGSRPPVPIRVTAIWKREGKQWLLIQSSNAVLSEHQSAAELVHRP